MVVLNPRKGSVKYTSRFTDLSGLTSLGRQEVRPITTTVCGVNFVEDGDYHRRG